MTHCLLIASIFLFLSSCFFKPHPLQEQVQTTERSCKESDVILRSSLGFLSFNDSSMRNQIMSATCVDSNFIIDGPFPAIQLTNLKYIKGDLVLLDSALKSFSAEYLESISGSLIIDGRKGGAENIETLRFDRLEYLGGDLLLLSLSKLTRIELPKLRQARKVVLAHNAALAEISLPKMKDIANGIVFNKNKNLSQFVTPKKLMLGTPNIFIDNPKLPSCTLARFKPPQEENSPQGNSQEILKNFIERGNDSQFQCPPDERTFFSFLTELLD